MKCQTEGCNGIASGNLIVYKSDTELNVCSTCYYNNRPVGITKINIKATNTLKIGDNL